MPGKNMGRKRGKKELPKEANEGTNNDIDVEEPAIKEEPIKLRGKKLQKEANDKEITAEPVIKEQPVKGRGKKLQKEANDNDNSVEPVIKEDVKGRGKLRGRQPAASKKTTTTSDNEIIDESLQSQPLGRKKAKKDPEETKTEEVSEVTDNDTAMEEATPAIKEPLKGRGKSRKAPAAAAASKKTKAATNDDASGSDIIDESRQLQVTLIRDQTLEKRAAEEKNGQSSGQGRGRKRAVPAAGKKAAKKAKEESPEKESAAPIETSSATSDFLNESASPSGKNWNLKIASWNINGVRAWLQKGGLSYLSQEQPDILCVQETKCSDDKLPAEVRNVDGYECHWLAGDKDGYSGVGLLSKQKPISVKYGIGIEEHDSEGRCITAEYEKFYLVATYVPNAGRGLVRLEYRIQWDKDFRDYLKRLDAEKPVVLCGDLNVAHAEIDLANPKTNKKNAGFTKEEREGFGTLLEDGFVDTFRHLYPDVKDAYTFWTYMMNARGKNVGWRLDYFVISKRFADQLCDSVIRKDVLGSDHCPVALFLHV